MEIPTFLLFDPVGSVNLLVSDANCYTHYAHISPGRLISKQNPAAGKESAAWQAVDAEHSLSNEDGEDEADAR
jgi:hypothetical protein